MISFVVRRLLMAIPVLLGIVFVTFALARVLPGDPCRAALGERATAAVCDAFIKRVGLDQPIPMQFYRYMGDVLHGDLGDSFRFGRPATQILVERLPMTVELSISAMIFAVLVSIPLGIISAYWHNSAIDVGTMIGANIGVSMPVFWLGLMLAYVFAVLLKGTPFWLAPSGRLTSGMEVVPLTEVWHIQAQGAPLTVLTFMSNMFVLNGLLTGNWALMWDAIKHLILPAAALGTIPLAIIARMTRSSLLDVLGLDYIRTARAKGLREWAVVLRHGLRNAMLPVVTVIGLSLGGLLSGAVLTETVFNLAGVGRTLTEAISGRDYSVIQGMTLITAVMYLVVNLLVDISYAYLDPRIRLG